VDFGRIESEQHVARAPTWKSAIQQELDQELVDDSRENPRTNEANMDVSERVFGSSLFCVECDENDFFGRFALS
jgi:hypothetical protein